MKAARCGRARRPATPVAVAVAARQLPCATRLRVTRRSVLRSLGVLRSKKRGEPAERSALRAPTPRLRCPAPRKSPHGAAGSGGSASGDRGLRAAVDSGARRPAVFTGATATNARFSHIPRRAAAAARVSVHFPRIPSRDAACSADNVRISRIFCSRCRAGRPARARARRQPCAPVRPSVRAGRALRREAEVLACATRARCRRRRAPWPAEARVPAPASRGGPAMLAAPAAHKRVRSPRRAPLPEA